MLLQTNIFAQAAKMDHEIKKELLQNVIHLIDENYVYPDEAVTISQYLKVQYETGKYDSLATCNELEKAFNKDLWFISKDKHIRITYNPDLEKDVLKFASSKSAASKFSQSEADRGKQKNFYFREVRILPSNIGYIEFNNFARPDKESRKTLHAVMQFISNTDALIIDLRNNYGGNGSMVTEMLAYFFDGRTYIGKTFNRIENTWTNIYTENSKKQTKGLVFDKPVYVLTSKETFSAAESLAYTLKYSRNAVIIGENTKGGAHLTRSFSLGNGFVGFIPYSRFENSRTETDWEDTGVIPDVNVSAENSLITAQQAILKKKLILADQNEKKKINWLLNYYRSKTTNYEIKNSVAHQYAGRFSEFEIIYENNQLKIRDTNQAGVDFKILVPITGTLFQVGNVYQVEFTNRTKDRYTVINMYWEDGWAEKIERQN
ncbi:hypothetical protein GCM10009120_51090 [Sphingobacterium siyangense subsp. cladoniae]